MRNFANLFLIVFISAAAVGVGAEVFNYFLPHHPLSVLRTVLDLPCALLALLVYISFAFNFHLPRGILLPPLIALYWRALDFWPMQSLLGTETYRFFGALSLLLIGLLALQFNRILNKKSLLLSPSQFVGSGFSSQTMLRFFLINLLVLPLALLLFGYLTASNLLEKHTSGFVHLKPSGLYMTEKVYQKDGKTLRLAAMIHLGRKTYFDDLVSSIEYERTLILAEGVSDQTGLLQNRFSYQRLADLLGLVSQEEIRFYGRLIKPEDLDRPYNGDRHTPDILRADVDLQEFDPQTIATIEALSKYLLGDGSLLNNYQQFNQWVEANLTPESNRVILYDLIERRNARLLDYLSRGLTNYDTIVIPWGALHMPGIERILQKQGFNFQRSRQRQSIDFSQLPYKQFLAQAFSTE